jgi:hypothetical protein
MARVFEDEVSILPSAKLDLLVYTDEVGILRHERRDRGGSHIISRGGDFLAVQDREAIDLL